MPSRPQEYNKQDALYALLGAGIGSAGGYGLYKLLTPKQHQTNWRGAGSAILGGAAGGGLGLYGSNKYRQGRVEMAEEAVKQKQEKGEKVQGKIDEANQAKSKQDSQKPEDKK